MSYEIIAAQTLGEAIEALKVDGAVCLAGGTDLMVMKAKERLRSECLVDLAKVDEVYGVQLHNDELIIGAMTTMTELTQHDLVKQHFPALAQAAAQVGSPQIRNRATIGGNICNSSPAGDTICPLMAYGAVLVLVGSKGARRVTIGEFLVGVGKNIRKQDEILTKICLPVKENYSIFEKVGKRNALAISVVNMTVVHNIKSGCISIALGSVAPIVVRATATEKYLSQHELTNEALNAASEVLASEIHPIDDIRADAGYRLEVAKRLLKKALKEVLS